MLAACFSVLLYALSLLKTQGAQAPVLLLLGGAAAYAAYTCRRLQADRIHSERAHAGEIAALHMRTIQALSLAIDAKDHSAHDHLRRVEAYAVELGRELGLDDEELHALRAAALLHDIGKLAVPDHIICKPGKLTPEEFEKVKIHPVVGASILEEVNFPYPVAPIVRAHHEKWDGSGYPCGLRGEGIPIGARILSVVDCLDALTSDRQYRRAMPVEDALAEIRREAGHSFDPCVVELLERHYPVLLEHVPASARATSILRPCDSSAPGAASAEPRFLEFIAAARHEVQALFEITQDLGNSLSLNETLSVLAVRLKRIVPFDAIAVYVNKDGSLVPEHASGDDFRLLASLAIPAGEGVSGWVSKTATPVVNGDPALDICFAAETSVTRLRSAISVPLQGVDAVVGAITLYRAAPGSFDRDNLRVLLAITPKVAIAVENALKYRQAEDCATTDYLTGLPNARSLFVHLDAEIQRSARGNTPLAIVVADLDGFKQINDRFGHLEGNRVLQLVAAGFRYYCREYDYVARMGGDEFVLVMPGMSSAGIDDRLQVLQEAVRAAGRDVCGEDILTLSVGVAVSPFDGADAESLLAEADHRMYAAKHQNRRTPVLA